LPLHQDASFQPTEKITVIVCVSVAATRGPNAWNPQSRPLASWLGKRVGGSA
jgi:hypothetical protein